MRVVRLAVASAALMAAVMVAGPAEAGTDAGGRARGDGEIAAHWTAARLAAATPRDLVVDPRGLAYRKRADGSLAPYGHSKSQLWASPASRPTPTATKPPPGPADTTGPAVTDRDPAVGAAIGASHTFSATVTDASGLRSVSFVVVRPNGTTQTFAPTAVGSLYSVTINGFTNGAWSWRVVARDNARRANTTTTATTGFTVDIGGGGGGGGGGGTPVANDPWTTGGSVQNAAGRIYFEMPTTSQLTTWAGYVCSGTVAEDATTGRSVIITAAHCVYDDVHKVFARNVLFIPNQDGTSGAGTDLNCSNDPMGCWTPSFGVVDTDWTTRTFPKNIPWDYAYYVVGDSGAHTGTAVADPALDVTAGDLPVQFTAPATGAFTHALGYSYSDDPNFMYCAENLAAESSYNDWWLGQCELSGGASGGPWLQPVSGGNGPIVSVNSWGYTNSPGMAGPRLVGSSASCVFDVAKAQSFATVTNRGVKTC
jgi:hypothetical protein